MGKVIKQVCLLALPLALAAAPAVWAVEVVDAEPAAPGRAAASGPVRAAAVPAARQQPSIEADLYYQLQQLREEVMQLRGMVEQQEYMLQQLKQQRLDDYLDLDRRLSSLTQQLSGGGGGAAPSVSAPAQSTPSRPTAATAPPSADAEQAYRAAYDLVKEQQFGKAKSAFKSFLEQHSDSSLAPNAHYWLGELYLLEADLDAARTAFSQLLERFSDHRKVPDAMFKLAKVYHLKGDNAKAKQLLQRVIDEYGNSDSSAPRLAKEYLRTELK